MSFQRVNQGVKKYVNEKGQNFDSISLRKLRGLPYHAGLEYIGRIGIDWIPPLNALIRMVGIPVTQASEISKTTSLPAPSQFTWDLLDDVKNRFQCNTLPLNSYVRGAPDQGSCGSCWAFAGAGMLGDRWRVWSHTDVPPLSQTAILSCAKPPNGTKCNGGNATADYDVCTRIGIPSEECVPYDWCGTFSCTSAGVPRCEGNYAPKCGDTYLARETTKQCPAVVGKFGANDYSAIIEEIWQNGPIMTGYRVYADFYGPNDRGANPVLWQDTDGVYMNGPGIYDYRWGNEPSSDVFTGNHMVVIVGWGKTSISGWTGPQFKTPWGTTGSSEIYYWVVRNSWGDYWNANNPQTKTSRAQKPGYFYVAWGGVYNKGSKSYRVNEKIGLDHTYKGFGGCWFFEPNTNMSTPEGCDGPPPPVDDDVEPVPDDDIEPTPDDVPVPEPVSTRNFWQTITSFFQDSCTGRCVWGDGQCVDGTPTSCQLISQGTGTFQPSQYCKNYNGEKVPKSKTETHPCVFDNASCVHSTEEVCDSLAGNYQETMENCREAYKSRTTLEEKSFPIWGYGVLFGFLALIVLVGIILLSIAVSRNYVTVPTTATTPRTFTPFTPYTYNPYSRGLGLGTAPQYPGVF